MLRHLAQTYANTMHTFAVKGNLDIVKKKHINNLILNYKQGRSLHSNQDLLYRYNPLYDSSELWLT